MEQILSDKTNDMEMIEMAKDLADMEEKEKYESDLKDFLLQKMKMTIKMQ